jgi:hypothetical protein
MCDLISAPECGCNGRTYGNEKAQLDHEGECAKPK